MPRGILIGLPALPGKSSDHEENWPPWNPRTARSSVQLTDLRIQNDRIARSWHFHMEDSDRRSMVQRRGASRSPSGARNPARILSRVGLSGSDSTRPPRRWELSFSPVVDFFLVEAWGPAQCADAAISFHDRLLVELPPGDLRAVGSHVMDVVGPDHPQHVYSGFVTRPHVGQDLNALNLRASALVRAAPLDDVSRKARQIPLADFKMRRWRSWRSRAARLSS